MRFPSNLAKKTFIISVLEHDHPNAISAVDARRPPRAAMLLH